MKRVVAKMKTIYNSNSDEYTEVLTQHLQQKKKLRVLGLNLFSYWVTIDTEIIPMFAWIQKNALGFTQWKSKWSEIDGVKWD